MKIYLCNQLLPQEQCFTHNISEKCGALEAVTSPLCQNIRDLDQGKVLGAIFKDKFSTKIDKL